MNAHYSSHYMMRMHHMIRICIVAGLALALFMIGCSSDDPAAPKDAGPFAVSSAGMVDVNKVKVVFNRDIDEATAGDVAHYGLLDTGAPSSPIEIYRADVQPDTRTVILTTAFLQTSGAYQLTVDQVKDNADGAIDAQTKDIADAMVSGTIVTWAGTGKAAWDGDNNILENSAFYFPINLTFTSTGCYILDWNNHRLRHVKSDNTLETVVGTELLGDGDLAFEDRNPPGVPGTEINLNHPTDADELPDGRILLSCWHNHKLRIYDPVTKLAYVACGAGAGFSGDGGDAHDALLNQPNASVVLDDGTIYILDQRNLRVRRIDGTTNIITTVAGNGKQGFAGDGGDPLQAEFDLPIGSNPRASGSLAVDDQGRLYVSDKNNNRVRRIDFDLNIIETVAGDGNAGYSGDGGSAVSASLNNPADIIFGPDGRLYIADEYNHRVRAVDMTTGIITTVAGNGEAGFSGDGGPATQASLYQPWGLAFDSQGYFYIADTFNHRIRRVLP